jgi:CubicO group peptidase (beta-lactamase class C family)
VVSDCLDPRLNDLVAAGRFRGALRVERGDSVLIDAAYGTDGAGTALAPGTAFQIASISKSFTAASVLLLADHGRLSIDEPLAKFIEAAPRAWSGIAVRHLLTHTSGLGHWPDVAGLDMYSPCPRDQLLARILATPLRFGPGTGWLYSSPGYVLLAHVVEVTAGIPYSAFVTSHVLERLELRHTSISEPRRDRDAARGSVAGEPTRSFDLGSVNVGTGDVWSTTADLARWPRALASSELLSREGRDMVFSSQAKIADEEDGLTDVGYGCGWFTARLGGHSVILHPGDQPGFSSLVAWAPAADVVIAALAADEMELGPLVLPTFERVLSR